MTSHWAIEHLGRQQTKNKTIQSCTNNSCKYTLHHSALIHVLFVTAATTCLKAVVTSSTALPSSCPCIGNRDVTAPRRLPPVIRDVTSSYRQSTQKGSKQKTKAAFKHVLHVLGFFVCLLHNNYLPQRGRDVINCFAVQLPVHLSERATEHVQRHSRRTITCLNCCTVQSHRWWVATPATRHRASSIVTSHLAE